MEAKEMFKMCGYELQKDDDETIEYYFVGLEDKIIKNGVAYGTDIEIDFHKNYKTYSAYSKVLKEDYEDCSVALNMNELKAINQQCKELGWFK